MFTKIYEFMADVPNHPNWVAASALCSCILVALIFRARK